MRGSRQPVLGVMQSMACAAQDDQVVGTLGATVFIAAMMHLEPLFVTDVKRTCVTVCLQSRVTHALPLRCPQVEAVRHVAQLEEPLGTRRIRSTGPRLGLRCRDQAPSAPLGVRDQALTLEIGEHPPELMIDGV